MNSQTSATSKNQTGNDRPSLLTSLVTGLRDDLQTRRTRRAERRRLEAELSTYTSPSDRDDLNAILSRYDDADVAEIRRILDRTHAA